MHEIYLTKEEVLKKAETALNKSLREVISKESTKLIEEQIGYYGLRRKGLLGDITEKYFFNIHPGNVSNPDFAVAEVELKTTPLKKHKSLKYVSKERLVFSMINYEKIIEETWEKSSFLNKNKSVLLMFYLWLDNQSILDYEFKFIHLLNLLENISSEDALQIKKDWEFIVNKIRRGEAHLLSEGDTYYLGACTKATNSRVVREQPANSIPAKPRAFSFKQQYMNYIVQSRLLSKSTDKDSIFANAQHKATIEETIHKKFTPFLGKTDNEILSSLESKLLKKSKSYKRLIVNQILGVTSNKIEEFEKANITLRVLTLEHTGTLKESISFPAFDYKDLITQVWYDDKDEIMSDFHSQLETKKFLFVVFQKQKNMKDITLKKVAFWNFPMNDLKEAEKVWRKTIECINEGEYESLPKIKDSRVAHVRPHAKNAHDTLETPQKTQEIKRSFWLNAKYIENVLKNL